MLSTRLSVIAILILLFVVFLMSNLQPVAVNILFYSFELPIFYLISSSFLFGMIITLLFISLWARDKKLKEKLKKAKDEKKAMKQTKTNGLKQVFQKKEKKDITKDTKKEKKEEPYKSPFYD